MTDDELYRAYLAGDLAAGDELMLKNSNALTAYLAAFLHNPQDAEDLMLDCFTVILVDKPRIMDGNFRAYLYRVARNKANRLWKKWLKRNEFSLDETLVIADTCQDSAPEDVVLARERNASLQRCLNRITPQYREVLWLIYDRGMSYAQAAEVLGCNVKKIDHMLDNGKKRLRLELEKEGITHADI